MQNNTSIKVSKKEGYTMMEISGSINSYTFNEFQDELYSLVKENNVCIDLSKVDSLSSAGLGSIMSAIETAEETDHKVYCYNPSDIALEAIQSTGFQDLFNIIDSLDQIKNE